MMASMFAVARAARLTSQTHSAPSVQHVCVVPFAMAWPKNPATSVSHADVMPQLQPDDGALHVVRESFAHTEHVALPRCVPGTPTAREASRIPGSPWATSMQCPPWMGNDRASMTSPPVHWPSALISPRGRGGPRESGPLRRYWAHRRAWSHCGSSHSSGPCSCR